MKTIELTDKHKSKLLEICKILFPESNWEMSTQNGTGGMHSSPEEKHWLEECIKANKFISKEEALKTFDNFVLPKKWYIRGGNLKLINYLKEKNDFYEGTVKNGGYYLNIHNHWNANHVSRLKDFQEITFEQFEKYVLKENVSKILSKTSAINDEGCIFKIGDNVTYSEDNQQFNIIITHFKYKNGKVLVNDNNIDINDLSLIINTFKLPEKWKIQRSLENYEIINNYFKKKFPHHCTPSDKNTMIGISKTSWTVSGLWENKEITFEQFKKYVLNENN